MYRSKLTTEIILAWVLFLFFTPKVFAQPQVTEIQLSTTVNTGFYLAMFDSTNPPDGIWIDPNSSGGDSTTAPTGPANGLAFAAPAQMFGLPDGYGQLLLSVDGASVAAVGAELTNMGNNTPTNTNTTILGGANAPVNKTNIELDRAIPAGTTVTFTVDMNGEVPHLVAVMGGSAATVTYDSVTEMLTVETTTFATETNSGDTFNSIVGFMIVTDTSLGTTPLRIIATTNHWVGDIFPLLPGFDSYAAVPDNGGTQGTITAKCGTTIYGPTGQQRNINVFFPDSSIPAMFGPTVTRTELAAFADSARATGATITVGATNFGVEGTLAQFTYTFASPKDTTIGVAQSSSDSSESGGGGGGGGCFIATASGALH